jgi:hypothetical protein
MHTVGLALVLVLRTYDLFGIPQPEMAGAQRAAAAVLGRAGISVSWIACRPAPMGAQDSACAEARQPAELIVRLLAAPANSTTTALADARIDTEARLGTFATVFVDRIRKLAAASDLDSGTLMGRALAHEVGHLLFGSSAHSVTGVMRPAWSASTLRRQGDWAWTFSDDEADRLRTSLRERVTLVAVAGR